MILNLLLPEENEDETVSITANDADREDDREEWEKIRKGSRGKEDSSEEGAGEKV